uniref:B-cell CLL/lymphoma 9 protein-like n=1 Tax=Phallusia mammillata TaxID=59560 RepID=A0A6F9D7Q0_9ASCI|nr:B-cell CLL/lymphoma 9 protein-like [Phallusia mammillata]
MDTNHMTSTSIIGMPNSAAGSKLKGGSAVGSSPGNASFNNCTKSPLSSNYNNGRRSTSPFFSDPTSDDVLSKNGGALLTGSALPVIHGSNFPDPASSPPVAASQSMSLNTATIQGKRENSKLAANPSSDLRNATLLGLPHSNEGKGNTSSSKREITSNRNEKRVQINHVHAKEHRNIGLTRTYSNQNSNNFVVNRHNSLDCVKDNVITKSKDKSSSRQSPRATSDYLNDLGGRPMVGYESPTISYPSPSSSENALTTTTVARCKTKVHERESNTPVTATGHISNHLSRTSSSNSVSDLSRCSEVTDESGHTDGGNITTATSSEGMLTHVSYSPATRGQVDMESTLQYSHFEDSAIVDALGFQDEEQSSTSKPSAPLNIENSNTATMNREEVLPNDNGLNLDFQFAGGTGGPADLGQKALNLSAEDIRQTLNSVSAESDLPDLGSDSAVFDDQAMQLINNNTGYDMPPSSDSFTSGDTSRVLSPSITAVSVTASTSSTTSIVTTAVSPAITTMPSSASTAVPPNAGKSFSNDTFSGAGGMFPTSQTSSTPPSSTTPVSFSPTPGPPLSGKSHLQEILGVTDTNRLKKMARPVDSAQYQSTTTTSYSSNIHNQPGQVIPNTSTGPVQNLPSSPYHRFTSPTGGNMYQRHPAHSRTTNLYTGPPHNPIFDNPGMNPGAPGGYMDHSISPRPNMPFDPNMPPQHPNHSGGNNMPYQPMWQRQNSISSMMPSLGPGPDGSKSPRGPMGSGNNFPNRPVNPMSALQVTVNAIPESFTAGPGIGSLTKNNNNNMGPPNSFQGMPPSSGMGDFPSSLCSPVTGAMLPPPSPSIQQDKRSISADGTLGGTTTTKKGHKRERGQSVDSKDGDRPAPKAKRRKSRSKDESKKASAESKAASRSNSVSDAQANNQLMYIFNSEIANAAANVVHQGKAPNIVSYHQTSQRNCRMKPSKSGSLSGNASTLHKSPTQQSDQNHHSSYMTQPSRTIKSEANLTSPRPTGREDGKPQNMQNIKSEYDQSNEGNGGKHSSPSLAKQSKDTSEENLSEEQKRHREVSLNKLRFIKEAMLKGTEGSSTSGSHQQPDNGRWQGAPPGHYTMTKHLEQFIQTNNPVSASSMGSHVPSKETEWLRLVQAYNEKKRQNRKPDTSPPPYTPNGPPHRWMPPGHPMHDPGGPNVPGPEMMRYPHMRPGPPGRIPYEGQQIPPNYMGHRLPRGFVRPPGNRMYHGPGLPPAGVIGPKMTRPPVPRLPQPGLHPNEYPFSEKLKEKASLYQSEGMHGGPGGNIPFDMNNPDAPMGSEWAPMYGNPGSLPPNSRIPHMQETVSPSHGPLPGGMIMTSAGPVPSQSIDGPLPPGPEPPLTPGGGIDPATGMRISNPAMCPPNFPYSNKGSNSLPNYPDSTMSGPPPLGPHDMHPGMGPMNVPQERHGGRMVDAMERRREPRPPDLKLGPVPRSPSMSFAGVRHPVPSPRMTHSAGLINQSPFMHEEMGPGGLPQMSPHHPAVPRSPMITSPGGPINNHSQFMPMGQGNMPHQVPVDHPNMMPPNGPHSAGRGQEGDWGPGPPSSMVPPRTPSSAGMMPPNQGPRPPSAITEMIHKISSYPISMHSPLYQDAVKDTSSPPPLTHMNGNSMISQEPPPLTHNPNHAEQGGMPIMGSNMGPLIRTPTGNMMPQQLPGGAAPPGYDPGMSGPRSAGPRPIGPPMGDAYGGEYRPPSHSEMSMSPSMQGSQHGMMQPNPGMDMPGYGIPHNSMMGGPSNYPPHSGMMQGGPPAGPPGPTPSQVRTEFDLTGIIPSDKPSETLSYFPPSAGGGGAGNQDPGQGDPAGNAHINVRSPTMQQVRYPNTSMGQRPMTPGGNFPGNPMMRPSGIGGFGPGPNPPNYPPEMGPWEPMPNMGRPPQMMQNSAPGMHSAYPGGRSLI